MAGIAEETPLADPLPPYQPTRTKRPAEGAVGAPTGKRAKGSKLAAKVDQLSAELGQMEELLMSFQSGVAASAVHGAPTDEDALSIAASAT